MGFRDPISVPFMYSLSLHRTRNQGSVVSTFPPAIRVNVSRELTSLASPRDAHALEIKPLADSFPFPASLSKTWFTCTSITLNRQNGKIEQPIRSLPWFSRESRRNTGRLLIGCSSFAVCLFGVIGVHVLMLHLSSVHQSLLTPTIERLACLPPTKTKRVQSSAGSLWIFACGRCCWSAGFLGISYFPRPFIPCSILTSISLIGSQDLAVKSTQISSLTHSPPTPSTLAPYCEPIHKTKSKKDDEIAYLEWPRRVVEICFCTNGMRFVGEEINHLPGGASELPTVIIGNRHLHARAEKQRRSCRRRQFAKHGRDWTKDEGKETERGSWKERERGWERFVSLMALHRSTSMHTHGSPPPLHPLHKPTTTPECRYPDPARCYVITGRAPPPSRPLPNLPSSPRRSRWQGETVIIGRVHPSTITLATAVLTPHPPQGREGTVIVRLLGNRGNHCALPGNREPARVNTAAVAKGEGRSCFSMIDICIAMANVQKSPARLYEPAALPGVRRATDYQQSSTHVGMKAENTREENEKYATASAITHVGNQWLSIGLIPLHQG
ncbi:hypothetical protein PR048_007957 [Dryococelus australis]|uniref:Uncharacterized protein n=1 Tax=Dryococelus australis TaxID=614101 RepID=A0ABQ9HVQ0_9NEOP|nr:hypothetical protein PR048_007957 [Dryococelus australis]